MDVERELRSLDFSKFSKVKNGLLQKLLEMHQQQNYDELDFDELDSVSAAGNIYQNNYKNNGGDKND